MGPPSYMQSVVDRNVVMRRIPVQSYGYRVSFPGLKRPGRCVNHPLRSSAEEEERVELYLHSPCVPSWEVIG